MYLLYYDIQYVPMKTASAKTLTAYMCGGLGKPVGSHRIHYREKGEKVKREKNVFSHFFEVIYKYDHMGYKSYT